MNNKQEDIVNELLNKALAMHTKCISSFTSKPRFEQFLDDLSAAVTVISITVSSLQDVDTSALELSCSIMSNCTIPIAKKAIETIELENKDDFINLYNYSESIAYSINTIIHQIQDIYLECIEEEDVEEYTEICESMTDTGIRVTIW